MSFTGQYNPNSVKSGVASSAVTERRFISASATGYAPQVAKASATHATAKPMSGVSLDSASVGEAFGFVSEEGAIVIVEAGAAVTAGVEVQPDSSGRAIAFSETASQYNVVNGIALDAASAAGDFIRVLLRSYKYKA